MGVLQGAHNGTSLGKKLSSALLVEPEEIQYTQMNRSQPQKKSALYWIASLLLFAGLTAVLLLVVTQEESFIRDKVINKAFDSFTSEPLQWNELVFTQLWGFSSCIEFKDKHLPKKVTCRYENKPAFWSIHGIWPSREGTEGPSFCSKVKFDVQQLEPIRSSLDEFWYEIDNTKQGNYFWSHEWTKHGSCAKELDTFGTELKYFSAALDLRKKYDLYTILKENDIVPQNLDTGMGYSETQISNAITKSLGPSAIPYVQCLAKKDEKTNELKYYILAVELCFTKDLQFMPCRKNRHVSGGRLGDNAGPCPTGSPVYYVDTTI